MNQERNDQDLHADPRLTAALRGLGDEPPVEEVDWEALRGSIRSRAELPLARRRRRARWVPASWSRSLVPLTAAASLAFGVWLGGGIDLPGELPVAAVQSLPASEQILAEELLQAEMSEIEFQLFVSGRAEPEQLLLIAIGDF
jgi:hypothetical protein